MAVIGIDLGGTKIAGASFTGKGEIIQQLVQPLAGAQGKQVGEMIHQMIRELCANTKVRAVGISVPGIAHISQGTVWAPNIPGWDDYPLIKELTQKLRIHNLKIVMDSDRACYIQGERWRGKAKDCNHAIFLAVGTGIGAGIMVNGHILRGSHDIAGALGWLALDRPYRPEYESYGNFEYHASGPGLLRIAKDWLKEDEQYQGVLRHKKNLSTQDLFAAFEQEDTLAGKVMAQAIQYWGMAVANLVSIFNPEKIIFGGGVFGPAARFLESIEAEARLWAQPISMNQVSLDVSDLSGEAGLIGAAYLALAAVDHD